jgi:hypothetical protein
MRMESQVIAPTWKEEELYRLIDPRGVGNLSTVLGQNEIDRFGAAMRAVLGRLL